MQLLVLNGQREAALLQYQAYQQHLSEVFTVAPSAGITQLYEQIQQGPVQRPLILAPLAQA